MKPDTSVVRVIEAFHASAETYLMIAAGISAWAAANPKSIPVCAGDRMYLGKTEATDEAICRTIAALMTVTAIVSCCKDERTFTADIDSNVSPIDNMLRMMGRVDEQENQRHHQQTLDPIRRSRNDKLHGRLRPRVVHAQRPHILLRLRHPQCPRLPARRRRRPRVQALRRDHQQ
jgi:hypothetical protein